MKVVIFKGVIGQYSPLSRFDPANNPDDKYIRSEDRIIDLVTVAPKEVECAVCAGKVIIADLPDNTSDYIITYSPEHDDMGTYDEELYYVVDGMIKKYKEN